MINEMLSVYTIHHEIRGNFSTPSYFNSLNRATGVDSPSELSLLVLFTKIFTTKPSDTITTKRCK